MLAATLLALLPALALASPIQKRYTNQLIQSYRTGTCLSLAPGTAAYDGAPLVVCNCDDASTWDITPGSGSVVLSGTNFALDAGENPHDFVGAKIWQSYPGLYQQTWFLTGDNRIAITGGTMCLDEGDNGPQTYTCTTGDTNQIWYVKSPGSATPTSTSSNMPSMTPTATSSSTDCLPSPVPTVGSPQWATTPQQIVFAGSGQTQRCLDVQYSEGYDGSPVNMADCQNCRPSQLFLYRSDGAIQWVSNDGKQWCLDAGSNPSNGTPMKLWQCYSGLPQQTWKYLESVNTQLQTANNQCLDVDDSNETTLQTWTCSAPDPQQEFVLDGYQYKAAYN